MALFSIAYCEPYTHGLHGQRENESVCFLADLCVSALKKQIMMESALC